MRPQGVDGCACGGLGLRPPPVGRAHPPRLTRAQTAHAPPPARGWCRRFMSTVRGCAGMLLATISLPATSFLGRPTSAPSVSSSCPAIPPATRSGRSGGCPGRARRARPVAVHARRRERKSPWRKLGCFRQALLVLAHPQRNETFAQAGAGFGCLGPRLGGTSADARTPRSHRSGRAALLAGAHAARDERAGHRPSGGDPLGFSRAARADARPGRCPRARHRHACLPGRSSSSPTAPARVLAPPSAPRTTATVDFRALPTFQPCPCPSASPGRARLRPAECLAHPPPGTLFNQPHQPYRHRRPHLPDLREFRMRETR